MLHHERVDDTQRTGGELADILGIAVILLAAGLFLIASGRGLRRAPPTR